MTLLHQGGHSNNPHHKPQLLLAATICLSDLNYSKYFTVDPFINQWQK